MARYVTVTAAQARSVAVTLVSRTAAVSRRYLFGLSAKASIAASRTVGAALSRGRTSLVPVRAAGVLLANVVARRGLAPVALGRRVAVAALGAKRVLAAIVAAPRSAVGGMVRWRPGAGSVSASRAASAVPLRGRVMFDSVSGARTVGVAPYTSTLVTDDVMTDSLGANVVDSSGQNILVQFITRTTSYLRWRVAYPVVTAARSIAATLVARRFISASAAGLRTASARPIAKRLISASFVADYTVQRLTAFLQRLEREVVVINGSRVVVANVYGIKPLNAALAPSTRFSASLFNSTLMTDSNGNPITDSAAVQFNVYA